MSLHPMIQNYAHNHFYIFPISRKGKHPLIKDNLSQASTDENQIEEWAKRFPRCNWGLSLAKSGLVVVDVDRKYGGLEIWESMIDVQGEPETLQAISGSGGRHYVFTADKTKRYRGKIQDGIDVKYNGYIVVEPSAHAKTGFPYAWINPHSFATADVPEWLEKLMVKDERGRIGPIISRNYSDKYLSACVSALKEQTLTYDEWVRIGMAIHASDPSENGLELYQELTHGVSYQEGDLERAQDKWNGFKASGGITPGTLTWIMREKGLEIPNPFTTEDALLLINQTISDEETAERNDRGFTKTKSGRWVCFNENRIIEYFNGQGFAFIKDDLKNPFAKLTEGIGGKNHVRRMTEKMLKDLTSPFFYAITKQTSTGIKTITSPAYKSWMESTTKTEYNNVIFEPNADAIKYLHSYNLWGGIPLERQFHDAPENESPSFILDMIFKSLCNSDKIKFDWLLDWLAHIIQFPQVKATVVPVFIGMQGTGKGLLMDTVMARMLSDLYVRIETAQELTNRFNVHLSGKLLTHIDEATWRGNKSEDGLLKSIIGSPTLNIEEKFGGRYTVSNYSRYVISSNNPEAVAIEIGNRRYCVIETSNDLANDKTFFRPIVEALENDAEILRFYGFLKRRDVSAFDPFSILANNMAGADAKISTIGIVAEFWNEILFHDPAKIFCENKLLRRESFEYFSRFARDNKTYERNITPRFFWRKTLSIFPFLEVVRVRVGDELSYGCKTGVDELRKSFIRVMQIEPVGDLPDEGEYQVKGF